MTEAPNGSLFSIQSHSLGSPCTAVQNLHEVQLADVVDSINHPTDVYCTTQIPPKAL